MPAGVDNSNKQIFEEYLKLDREPTVRKR